VSKNGQVQEPHCSQPEQEGSQERHQEASEAQVHQHEGRKYRLDVAADELAQRLVLHSSWQHALLISTSTPAVCSTGIQK
jgi:hypothetical protein